MVRILDLPVVTTPLSGVEAFECVQANQSRRVSFSQLQLAVGIPVWGTIIGALSNQLDLQAALNLKANLISPVFAGLPTAPTAAVDLPGAQLATLNYVLGQASSTVPLVDVGAGLVGVSTRYARADHRHPISTAAIWGQITGTLSNQTDLAVALSLLAPLTNPVFLGNPTAPTPPPNDNDTSIATTAYVIGQASNAAPLISSGPVGVPGTANQWARGDHVHPAPLVGSVAWGSISGTLSDQADLQAALNLKAPLASPVFTGTPTVPQPPANDVTSRVISGAWYAAQASNALPIISSGIGDPGTSLLFSRADHFHPPTAAGSVPWGAITGTLSAQADLQAALNLKANLSNPAFTGAPTTPQPAVDSTTQQIVNAAFVTGQASTSTPLVDTGAGVIGTSLRYARADHQHPPSSVPAIWGTITGTLSSQADLQAALNLKANIAGPTFTGVASAPTPAQDLNTTQLATTQWYISQASAVIPPIDGGVGAVGVSARFARADHQHPPNASAGTVTAVTIAAANGFTGTVANQGTTPALTIIPGNITPISVAATGAVSGSTVSDAAGNVRQVPVDNKTAAAYTLVLADGGRAIVKSNSTAQTTTVPANATVAFPIGTLITFVNLGGTTLNHIVAPTGAATVFFNGVSGNITLTPGSSVTLIKVATNTWQG
jgi:hypothetical protein